MTAVNRGRYAPSDPPPFPGSAEEATRYTYAWNQPRPAVGRETDTRRDGFGYLTPNGTRKQLTFADLAEEDEKPDRCKFLRRRLAALPQYLRHHYARKLETLDARDRRAGDRWLINTFERHILSRIDTVNERYLPVGVTPGALLPVREQLLRLLWARKKELKRLAYTLVDIFTSEFIRESNYQLSRTGDPAFAALSGYGRIASLARHLNTPIPGWSAYCKEELEAEDALRIVLRLESPKWWLNRLRRIHARWREHLLIAAGYVQKKSTPYASAPCVSEWHAQKKANTRFLQAMDLEDQDTGERTSLVDKVAGSVANPANRRRELMTRMRGFEDLAQLQGLAGDFYTLTAPSKFHAMQHDGKRNNKYTGASPRKTQKYLCNVWAKVRAAWKRHGIRVFGFRVAEPHHDATPHWHLLLFMRPDHVGLARATFRQYALEEDGNEPGAEENRFKVVPIDNARGGATGYIAKYIAKNIDGFALDDEKDDETGEDLKAMSRRVSAWASRWAIRQFQQIGGAPVTVYRELRRLRDSDLTLHPDISPAHVAADSGDWAGYITAQGGPLVTRDALRVRLSYETTENGNDFGDDVSRISGVYSPQAGKDSLIFTRTSAYKIVPKLKADDTGEKLGFSGGSAAPRSSVNNCTRQAAQGFDGDLHADSDAAAPAEIAVSADDGATVNVDALTRKEKREIAQRLTSDVKRKRGKRGTPTPPPILEGRETIIAELLAAKGLESSPALVKSVMAGAAIACGDLVYSVVDGRLVTRRRGEEKSPARVMAAKQQTRSLISRMKAAFRRKNDAAGAE